MRKLWYYVTINHRRSCIVRKIYKAVSVLVLMACLLSCFSVAAFAAGGTRRITKDDEIKYYVIPYVIVKGDTICGVYRQWGLNYKDYEEDIKSLNGVDDLDLLFVGAIYLLPTTLSNVKTDVFTTVMAHQMKRGETMYDVCAEYGIDFKKSESKLRTYNQGADLTRVQAGKTVLIPID